jgi:RNA polymerase sigma factor (sigma-70 family)
VSQALTTTAFMGLDSGLSPKASRLQTMPVAAATDSTETPDQRRAAWMAAAQAGDRQMYEKLLADSVGLIRAAARRRGVAPDHVDDVVQETLITVHRVRHTYDPSRSYDAWITALANRRAIDALRSRGRRDSRELHDEFAVDNHADHDDASRATESEQRARHLHAAIDSLPPGQREAMVQLGLREHSLKEASKLTGRQPGALKVNLHRALKTLRERFHGEP